jgi:CRISPR/Cas system CSM-associated protein Csm3 (group 7 of RAMP superfamily)
MPRRRDRVEIVYRLQFQGAVHCGTGLRAGVVDHTTVRARDGSFRIPGSTVKGVVRSQCEWLADLSMPDDTTGEAGTLVETLFGSARSEGTLFWDDATAAHVDRWAAAPARTRLAVSRSTRTAIRDRLFTRDHVPEGAEFVGRVHGWLSGPPLPNYEAAFGLPLLVGGLLLANRIGAGRSSGLGRCHVSVDSVRLNGHEVDLKAVLEQTVDLQYFGVAAEEG